MGSESIAHEAEGRMGLPIARLQRESAWIQVLSRTGTQDNNFLFFSSTLIQSFRIQLQKHLPTIDEVNELEQAR